MAASFAAYASQYLNRQQQQQEASTLSSSHPMFFSFSTEDGSRGGHGPDSALLDDYDLDDPHLNLRESGASEATARRPAAGRAAEDEEDDDPYLRLDEDERTGRYGFQSRDRHQKARLIGSSDDQDSSSSGSPKGWLAHLAASPSLHMAAATPRPVRSPSPARSSSSDFGPPAGFFGGGQSRKGRLQQSRLPPPPRTQRNEPPSLSLTESLLPRDGRSRPMDVFSLPDPRHLPRGRRKHHDSIWTSAWLAGVTICVVSSIVLLFAVRQPEGVPRKVLPYVTLVRTVPLLTILTFVAAAVAYVHIFLLQIFVKPVMIATSVFIPVTLLISALWAFIGSFMWEEGTEPTWGETVGLRLFSIVPLLLAAYTGRKLTNLPNQIHTTSSTLTLVTHLLMANPFLLALSPAILLAMLLASLPFLTLIFRLLLVGYVTGAKSTGWEWHLYAWANWAITGAVAVWLWTWGVARGGMRLVAAGVIGAWYFADPNLPPPPPTSTHTIHSAIFRAYDHSLGTIVLSALILTAIRMLTLLTLALQRAPPYLPLRTVAIVMPAIRFIIGWIDGITTALSKYALVYAGLTGDDFMSSARRSRALTTAVETAVMQRGRRRGFGKEPPLTLLTISPLVLTFPFALITYLFVAHTLGAPHEALGASLLAGGTTALVGLFCVGLVKDTADTLYVCYCIDKDAGDRHRDEVFIIFEPDGPAQPANTRNQRRPQQGQHAQSKVPQRPQTSSNVPSPAPVGQAPVHGRVPSFSGASKAPLSPFSGPVAGPSSALTASRPPPPLTEPLPGPFSDDEESASPREADLDPFKKSLVDPLGPSQGLIDEDGDMYASESTAITQPTQPVRATQPLPVQVKQQQRLVQQPGHHRTGSAGSVGMSPPGVSAFIQRNRGFVAGRSPPAAAVGVGLGAAAGYGFPSSPSRASEIAKAGRKEERMLTSAELNMKSHVFEGRSRGRLDDSSGSEDGDEHSIDGVSLKGSGGAPVHYGSPFASPRRPEGSMLEPMDMEEGDVNPFEAAGELEQGLSARAEPSRDMEESDLYPGSGFFD